MEQYQDIWVNGETKRGVRECASRYEAIKKQLEPFDRPFTVLDIGANLGYFSFRIAHDFPNAVCVLIESQYADWLLKLAKENGLDNIIVLRNQVGAEILGKLADCEHFDVVLALNVIHHIGDVPNTIAAVERLGEAVIIETPSPEDRGSCGKKHLKSIYDHVDTKYFHLGNFSRHTSKTAKSILGINRTRKTGLVKKYWDSRGSGQAGIDRISITSNDSVKRYRNARFTQKGEVVEERDWLAGINLRTFQYLDGIFPDHSHIVEQLSSLDITNHGDVAPWNVVISGKSLHLIDGADQRHQKVSKRRSTPTPVSVKRMELIKKDISSGKISTVRDYTSTR